MQKLVLLLLITSVFCESASEICSKNAGNYSATLTTHSQFTAEHVCQIVHNVPSLTGKCNSDSTVFTLEGKVQSCWNLFEDPFCDDMCNDDIAIVSSPVVDDKGIYLTKTPVTTVGGTYTVQLDTTTSFVWQVTKEDSTELFSTECYSVDQYATHEFCNKQCHDWDTKEIKSVCRNSYEGQMCACDDDIENVREEIYAGWDWCYSIDKRASTTWCNQNCHDGAGQLHPACNPNSPKQDQTCNCPSHPVPSGRCFSIDARASTAWCNINCHDGAGQLHPACNPSSPRQDQTCHCRS